MSADKHICFFISSLANAGGTERVCTRIANKLSELGFKATILSMYAGEPFFELNKSVQHIFINRDKYLSKITIPFTILKLRRVLIQMGCDVLVNVDSAMFVYAQPALLGLKIKNLAWEHFNYNSARGVLARKLARRMAAKWSDGIITLTMADAANWQSQQICKAPIFTIYNPVPIVKKREDRDDKNVVISVGRLHPQKGFDRLLIAWSMIEASTRNDWKLHIIGSGELKQELEEQIQRYGSSQTVKLIPATRHIDQHYDQADIFCLSSRYEGFPMVLLEAQAHGLPIVSFDCETGPAEIITHKHNGMLVSNGDCKALADALADLMVDDKQRKLMGLNAFREASRFDIDVIIRDWQHILQKVLNA